MSDVRIQLASAADGSSIRALLTAAALPTDDLEEAPSRFWVARDGRSVGGVIGLERYGDVGMLRSLVVSSAIRRRGVGRDLVSTVEQQALEAGVGLVVLLTQTAESFFKRLDYAVVDRAYVPDEIKLSAEFRSLCPASAVCMTKSVATSTTK